MRGLLVLCLVLGTGGLFAQDYQTRLNAFGLQVLGGSSGEGEILSTGKGLLNEALTAKDDFSAGEVLSLIGLYYIHRGSNGQADQILTQAEQYAQSAVRNPNSDNLRLLAEIRTRFMVTKGFPYILGNAGAIEELAKRSLTLNPQNQRSQIIIAYGKINAPGAFGGDPDLGIRQLMPIFNSPQSPGVKWAAAMGLALGYDKKGDKAQARFWAKAALDLFPSNWEAKKLVTRLAS